MAKIQVEIPKEEIAAFCKRNHIRKFSLFGSVLRDDFRPESDIDVLVEFDTDAKISLFDLIDMEEELASILGRKVDLIEASALRNPFRRYEILRTQQVIYDV
jgi:predicted nucleotidyltransferase